MMADQTSSLYPVEEWHVWCWEWGSGAFPFRFCMWSWMYLSWILSQLCGQWSIIRSPTCSPGLLCYAYRCLLLATVIEKKVPKELGLCCYWYNFYCAFVSTGPTLLRAVNLLDSVFTHSFRRSHSQDQVHCVSLPPAKAACEISFTN